MQDNFNAKNIISIFVNIVTPLYIPTPFCLYKNHRARERERQREYLLKKIGYMFHIVFL